MMHLFLVDKRQAGIRKGTRVEVPIGEREGRLWLASEQYMRGEIDTEQLKEEERKYAPNLFKEKKRRPFLDAWRDFLLAKISKIFE